MARAQPRLPLLIGAASTLTIFGLIGTALLPTLVSYSPLLLMALSPRPAHIILVAPSNDMLPIVAVAAARRVLSSLVGYYVGLTYAARAVEWLVSRQQWLKRPIDGLLWLLHRAASPVLFVAPTPSVSALVASTGMRVGWFLPIVTLGHIAWVSATFRLGQALSPWVMPIVKFFDTYMLPTTLAFAALVAAYYFLRRGTRRAATLSAKPHEG